ncbi:MAG: carbohydrate ABC transporter permease [Chloroflexi bacterium]|nr:MAG: carbohydrate ABC transporter permease [Chloroflexota bacterium]
MSAIQRRALRRRRINRGINYLIGILIALWIILPIYLIASLAFSSVEGVRDFPKTIFPFTDISLETFKFFINTTGIVDSTINSVIVAMMTLVLSTLIAAPAGYALSRYIFPGRDLFRLGILAVRAFPIVILAVPLAVMFINLNIFDEVYTVALMHTALTLPTTVLVIASVFASVPRELEEAAIVFGATPLRAFLSVVMPLALPGIAASAIFTFVMSWNEVFAATILTLRNRTLPAQVLSVLDTSPEPFQFAGGFFMLIPSLIFIFFIRRYLFNMWGQVSK